MGFKAISDNFEQTCLDCLLDQADICQERCDSGKPFENSVAKTNLHGVIEWQSPCADSESCCSKGHTIKVLKRWGNLDFQDLRSWSKSILYI